MYADIFSSEVSQCLLLTLKQFSKKKVYKANVVKMLAIIECGYKYVVTVFLPIFLDNAVSVSIIYACKQETTFALIIAG